MQNKPNFDKCQNKPNPLYKRDLRKFLTPSDNEKQTQSNPRIFANFPRHIFIFLLCDCLFEFCIP